MILTTIRNQEFFKRISYHCGILILWPWRRLCSPIASSLQVYSRPVWLWINIVLAVKWTDELLVNHHYITLDTKYWLSTLPFEHKPLHTQEFKNRMHCISEADHMYKNVWFIELDGELYFKITLKSVGAKTQPCYTPPLAGTTLDELSYWNETWIVIITDENALENVCSILRHVSQKE